MIKNERQYRITKSRVEEFERALATDACRATPPRTTELQALERAAAVGQLQTMRDELADYESLAAGNQTIFAVDSFEELPVSLIRARISIGLSQKELATRLGLKEQQIQRYEATDYASASLSTILRVIDALGIRVRKDVLLPNADLSLAGLWRRLKEAGLPRSLVVGRMLPTILGAEIENASERRNNKGEEETLALRVAASLGRIFNVGPATFFSDRPPVLSGTAGALARFKVSASAEATRLGAYTIYAHYLALVVLNATPFASIRFMPETAAAFRHAVQKAYTTMTFTNVLRFAWDCGVVVLPLNDSGAFHGACWRVKGRHVVVLKQRNQALSRWFFDLLHELRHTKQEEQDPEFSVIEAEETSQERRESVFEQDADVFAANVLLDDRAKELVRRCVDLAGGSVERLKSIVPKVAQEANVDVGALANYVAFRLARQGTTNWWGAAANLQASVINPWEQSRDVFLERVDFSRINPVDRELITRALSSA